MMKTQIRYQFDLSLYINDNIICQRHFNNFNYKEKSIEFNDAVEIITVTTDLVKKHIKSESIDLMWNHYDNHNSKQSIYIEAKKDILKLTISYNSKLVASSFIDGYYYPSKIKYRVDIRPIIPIIISNIRFYLQNVKHL